MDNFFMDIPGCTATLSANAGLSMMIGGAKIWIDALNVTKVNAFSTVTPEIRAKMRNRNAFRDPDAIVFTHCHPDHFSQSLTEEAIAKWPRAEIMLPEQRFEKQTLVEGDVFRTKIDDAELCFLKVTHEGEPYRDVPNYAIVISDGNMNVLITGDTEVGSKELPVALRNAGFDRIDLVFVDFPWVTLKRGREGIDSWMKPKHLFVYHLPFEEDDTEGFRDAARKYAAKLESPEDIRFFMEPLQTESVR